MASHTALPARPPRGPARGAHTGRTADAALPCQRRPDVFQHPLLEPSTDLPDSSPALRRQHLVLSRTARDLCASCPLWAECLQDAVVHAEPYGYAAATTLEDRRWIRRTLGIGDAAGDLPAPPAPEDRGAGPEAAPGAGDPSRRLMRLRSRTTDPAARHPSEHGWPEIDAILDAFDIRQEQLASQRRALRRTLSGIPTPLHEHTGTPPTYRTAPPPSPQLESRTQDMAAAESGQRIAFSYEDPAQAVRQTLLGPLIRSALPALTSLEQLATMLTSVPGGDITPELLRDVRAVRRAVAELAPCDSAGPDATTEAAPLRTLTGSVSVELAATDPVAALRRDFLEPLLRELAASLTNIEKVATMLAATEDADGPGLEPLRTALRGLRTHLPAAPGVPSGSPGRAATAAPHRRPATAPSIRAAVETAVSTFPGPFSARDVLRALPPGVYGDPSKTISNVLSSMVKSGRLRRLARGTYARTVAVTDHALPDPAARPGQDQAKSA
ncbi:WhiB family transcriptional regulator [Streptomyces sp. NPDC001857]|uniref:WhiB family transcriptional regulator n=1 Tax=unclassified Streptomyces TaxID=2593676 RepID=UPI00332809EA